VLLWRSRNPLRHSIVGSFTFFYLFMSFYENLGLTPAARYMVGVLPLLLPMLYCVLERLKRWDLWMVLTLLQGAMGVAVNWLLAAVPWMRYNKLQGENWILKITGDFLHLPLTQMEPSFQAPVILPGTYFTSVFWVAVTVGFTVWFLKIKIKEEVTTVVRKILKTSFNKVASAKRKAH